MARPHGWPGGRGGGGGGVSTGVLCAESERCGELLARGNCCLRSRRAHAPTHSLTHSPTTRLSTHAPTQPATYLLTYSPIHSTNLPSHQLNYPSTYSSTYRTHSPTHTNPLPYHQHAHPSLTPPTPTPVAGRSCHEGLQAIRSNHGLDGHPHWHCSCLVHPLMAGSAGARGPCAKRLREQWGLFFVCFPITIYYLYSCYYQYSILITAVTVIAMLYAL